MNVIISIIVPFNWNVRPNFSFHEGIPINGYASYRSLILVTGSLLIEYLQYGYLPLKEMNSYKYEAVDLDHPC